MTAMRQGRRKGTARDLAARLGVSERTIRNYVAEPRASWEARAADRRVKIRELRATGMTMRAIAAEVGCSVGTVHNALKDTDQPLSSEQSGHVHGHVHGRPRTCP